MESIQIQGWYLRIDRAATVLAYERLPVHTDACPCAYCENFGAACAQLPDAWLSVFQQLGVNPCKASGEVWQNFEDVDGWHQYGGYFHVCGELVGRAAPHEMPTTGLDLSFSSDSVLVDTNFPGPRFQLEVIIKVPWVLPKPIG